MFGLQHFLCASSLNESSQSSHAMFSTRLANLPNNPLSQVLSPTLRLKWAVKQHLLFFYLREGAVSNLFVITSILLLVRRRRVNDRTSDRLAAPLFLQDRETSANPLRFFHHSNMENYGAYFSHSRTSIEKSIARSHNKRNPVETQVVCIVPNWKMKIFCLNKEIFKVTSKGKLIKLSKENVQLRQNYLKHSLKWTDENGRCRVLTELFMNLASSFNPAGWNSINRINQRISPKGKRVGYAPSWKWGTGFEKDRTKR